MKSLPRSAVVLIAIAVVVLTLLLFGSILFALAVGLVAPLPLSNRAPVGKILIAVVIGIVVGYLSGFALAQATAASGGEVHFAGSFATMGLFASIYLLALRKQQKADDATRQAALSLQPPPGRARVIMRRQGLLGYGNAVEVTLDGRSVAQLSMGRFTAFDVLPGRHRLGAAVATVANSAKSSELDFELAAGQTAVFHANFAIARLLQGQVDLVRDADPAAVARALAGRTMVAAGTAPASPEHP